MQLYEAMFLVDGGKARDDLDAVRDEISQTVARQGAELVNCEKWEERKLAYPVKRHKRGTFLLSHFHAPPDAIPRIERAFQLSEVVLRVLITVDEDGSEIVSPSPSRSDRPFGDSSRSRSSGGSSPRRAPVQNEAQKPQATDAPPESDAS